MPDARNPTELIKNVSTMIEHDFPYCGGLAAPFELTDVEGMVVLPAGTKRLERGPFRDLNWRPDSVEFLICWHSNSLLMCCLTDCA